MKKLCLADAKPRAIHSWGSPRAYEDIFRKPAAVVLVDVPALQLVTELDTRVRALSRLAHVVVLVPNSVDPLALLKAGATNVLGRDAPSNELRPGYEPKGDGLVHGIHWPPWAS
jgi:hypothetical protein